MKPTLSYPDFGVSLGPCWVETCNEPGAAIVRGVLAWPSDPTFAELVATAERITRIGIVCCTPHADSFVDGQARLAAILEAAATA